jgi:hypothetical protein
MGKAVRRHALRDGRNHKHIAVAGQVFEIVVGRIAFGVDDDVLIVPNVTDHLGMGNDFEGQPVIPAALAPLGGTSDTVAIDQQSRGQTLQICGQMNGRRRFPNAAFIACHGDYHIFTHPNLWIFT